MRVLDVDAAAERVTKYLATFMSETGQLSISFGYTSPEQLQSNGVLAQAEPGRWVPLSGAVTSD